MADDDDPDAVAADDPDAVGDDETDATTDDDPDENPDDTPDDGADDRPERARVLDARTLLACALVAVIAALAAGLITRAVTGDETDDADGGTLVLAEEVPDIVLPSLDGDAEVRISDYRGRPLVVNFWGSWCEPCVDEMPAFERVHQSLGDEVAFLGVNVNDAPEAAARMVDQTGVTYDLARDVDGALGRALEVTTFPTTVLVLPDGTIVDTVLREMSAERLCEKINQSLLNQSLESCG